jgi:hypothetical protein
MKVLKKILHYFSADGKKERWDTHVQKVWGDRSDEDIIAAYNDNRQWFNNLKFLKMDKDYKLWETIDMRYNKLIKPQMDKRNLWNKVKL